MFVFHEHEGVRFLEDDEEGACHCHHAPPHVFKTVEEAMAAISARNAMPLIEHTVHLGNAEQFVYTYWAKDIYHLKEQLVVHYRSMKGEWVELDVEPGYPTGTRKFQVRWPNNAHAPTPIMVIVRGVRT